MRWAWGFGQDPMDRGALRFVYEKDLQAVPTMATAMGSPGIWWRDPRTGADPVKLVHGEQDVRLLRTLAPSGTLIARNRVISLTDKGAGKGAIAVVLRTLIDEATRRDGGRKPERHLPARRRRLQRGERRLRPGTRAAAGRTRTRRRPRGELRHAAGSGAHLPPERRREPAACRPRRRGQGRLRPADPARPVHLRHGRARRDREGAGQ